MNENYINNIIILIDSYNSGKEYLITSIVRMINERKRSFEKTELTEEEKQLIRQFFKEISVLSGLLSMFINSNDPVWGVFRYSLFHEGISIPVMKIADTLEPKLSEGLNRPFSKNEFNQNELSLIMKNSNYFSLCEFYNRWYQIPEFKKFIKNNTYTSFESKINPVPVFNYYDNNFLISYSREAKEKINNMKLLPEGNKKRKQLRKELFLNQPTSHGGWPNGGNNSWVGNKPVNDIIYDYLEDMGLADDVPHARLSETKIKILIHESIRRNLND